MIVAQFFSSWEGMKKGDNKAMGADFLLAHGLWSEDQSCLLSHKRCTFLKFLLKKGRIRPWATEHNSHRILQLPGLVVLNTKTSPLFRKIMKMNSGASRESTRTMYHTRKPIVNVVLR